MTANGTVPGGSLTLQNNAILALNSAIGVSINGVLTLGTGLAVEITSFARSISSEYEYTLVNGVSALGDSDWIQAVAKQYLASVTVNGTELDLSNAVLRYDKGGETLKQVSTASIPKPAAATLSLLTLGALALRRRRA